LDVTQPVERARGIRCLIADDHPAVLDAVSRWVAEQDGLELVATAQDGGRALKLIEQVRPTVAVIDIRMPSMDGIQIVRRLSERQIDTHVILYTGHSDQSLLHEAMDLGARGFLLKEAPLDDMLRAIQLVASGGTYVDPSLAKALVTRDAVARMPRLTLRERQILQLLADGMRNDRIAFELSISPLTVRTHITNAVRKLHADTRTQAVAEALRQSLIS
jgi:DNA-binding NarL/FixJ family response regulator